MHAVDAGAEAELVFHQGVEQPGGGAGGQGLGAVAGIGGVEVAKPGIGLPNEGFGGWRWPGGRGWWA